MDISELVNDVRAAEIIGVTPGTMRAWRNTGTGPPYQRVGGWAILYHEADLATFKRKRSARLRVKRARPSQVA